MVLKLKKMPEVFQIAPIGGSSFFLRGSQEKLLQKAGKWIAKNY
jgi:hypothetical protein